MTNKERFCLIRTENKRQSCHLSIRLLLVFVLHWNDEQIFVAPKVKYCHDDKKSQTNR